MGGSAHGTTHIMAGELCRACLAIRHRSNVKYSVVRKEHYIEH